MACIGRTLAWTLLSAAVALAAGATCARAEVSIHANRDVVYLEASNAPIDEVLSALESIFSIRHRTSVPLDQTISGTYSGSLRRVLSRLLDGFNYYVADTADGRIEIMVVGRPGATVVSNLPSASVATPQIAAAREPLKVPPPTVEQVAAERQKAHHRRPP